MSSSQKDFKIGGFLVQPQLNRICGAAGTRSIEPKMMGVLVCLARSAGEVVERAAILDEVWSDTHVTDSVLNRSVAELRRIFSDDPAKPRVIETIRGRGYRLVAPVHPIKAELDAPSLAGKRRGRALAGLGLAAALFAVLGTVFFSLQEPAADGTSLQALGFDRVVPRTSFSGLEIAPALSPDGDRLAFSRQAPGSQWRVYWSDEGGPARALNSQPGQQSGSAWSPRGERIAYNHEHDGRCALFSADLLGTSPVELTQQGCHGGLHSSPSWSPDGSRVYFTDRMEEDSTAIFSIEVHSGLRRQVTHPPKGLRDSEPSISPDGSKLAFNRRDALNTSAIRYVRLADGADVGVASDRALVYGLDWESDDQLIAASTRGDGFALWRYPTDGDSPELMLVPGWKMHRPSLARRARKLAYEVWFYDSNVWSLDTRGSARRPLVSSTFFDRYPQFSPNGEQVAFVSNRSGRHELWRADHDGSGAERLTDIGLPFESAPRWSPSGGELVFFSDHEGQPDLYRIDVRSQRLQRLTNDRAEELAPNWAADGSSVYFASRRSGDWQIWSLPGSGGEAVQVTTSGGYWCRELGEALYFTKLNQPGLWRRDARGTVRILEDLQEYDWRNWAVSPEGVYYVRRTQQGPSIAFRSWETNEVRTVGDFDQLSTWGIDLSPSGEELLITPIDHQEADIIVLESSRAAEEKTLQSSSR